MAAADVESAMGGGQRYLCGGKTTVQIGVVMPARTTKQSIQYFETQFRHEAASAEFALNPFEAAVLPHLSGAVLDLGCGLGHLSILAARAGCHVEAYDGSETAVRTLNERAAADGLPVRAHLTDLENTGITGTYDSVVSIGLLMFFPPDAARRALDAIKAATKPGGVAAVNVLIEGTTFLDMFNPDSYTLFGEDDLDKAFAGWDIILSEKSRFDAPHGTLKRFATVVARRPGLPRSGLGVPEAIALLGRALPIWDRPL